MPAFPEGLEYLWHWYQRLSNRRQIGMDVNPISIRDIEAFANLNQIELRVWEVEALEQIDNAVMSAWRTGRMRPRNEKPSEELDAYVPAANAIAVKALMQGLKTSIAARMQKNKDG